MGHDELVMVNCRNSQELIKLLNKSLTGKKACVLQRWDGCREGLQKACLCVGSQGVVASRLTANGSAV
jgi:hypothetical protein